MLIVLLVRSAVFLGGAAIWAVRDLRLKALDADSEIPDTVPTEWVDAFWAEKSV